MTLEEKYRPLIHLANSFGVKDLQVREQNGVLYIDGEAPVNVKEEMWNMYSQIDPQYRSGDLRLNIHVEAGSGTRAKVTTDSTNLNIRRGPGTDEEITGKAAHGAIVTVLKKHSEQWWHIRNESGVEGYVYAQYLTPIE